MLTELLKIVLTKDKPFSIHNFLLFCNFCVDFFSFFVTTFGKKFYFFYFFFWKCCRRSEEVYIDIPDEIVVKNKGWRRRRGKGRGKRSNQSCRKPRKWLQNRWDSKVFLILAKQKNVYDASFLSSVVYIADIFFSFRV